MTVHRPRLAAALLVMLALMFVLAPASSGAGTPALYASPSAVSMTATKTDTLVTDNDGDTLADVGDTLKYTVAIANGGSSDATGVSFTDTLDAHTTLAGSVSASPVAVNDSYPQTVIGNVSINSANIPYSVTGNDFLGQNPTATIDQVQSVTTVSSGTITASTAQGGTVVMTVSGSGMGQFTYDPPTGYKGTDTFTYRLTDNANATSAATNRTGTVNLTVSGMVWFINNNTGACSANCDGRLSHPFTTLAAFQAVNDGVSAHPAANDNIFLYESATSYSGGVTLLSGQKLIGQDSTSSLSTITGLTPPSGSTAFPAMNTGAPATTIVNSGGNGVTLNSGNTLTGLTVGASSGSAISGSGFGTLTVADVIVNTTGQALSLTNGTLNATFSSITSSGGTNNILLDKGSGSLGGTLTINGGALSGSTASGAAFKLNGGTASVTYNGTISKSNANSAVVVNGTTGGTIAFGGAIIANTGTANAIDLTTNTGATINFTGGLNLTTTGGVGFNATGGGTVNATQDNSAIVNTVSSGTGTALNVANTTIGASGVTFRSIASNGAPSGIVLNNTGSSGGLTVTGNGGSCTLATPTCTGGIIQNSTGPGISLQTTKNVSLTRMKLQSSGKDGIGGPNTGGIDAQRADHGDSVNGLIFDNGIIADTNTSGSVSGTVADNGIDLSNVTGTFTVSNSVIDQAPHNGIYLTNTNVALNAFNVTNTTISNMPNTSTSNNGILVVTDGTNTSNNGMTAMTVTNSTFTNIFATGIQVDTNDNSTNSNITVGGATTAFTNHFTNNNIAMNFTQASAGNATINILNNTDINNHNSHALNMATAQASTGGGITTKIQGNSIGTAGVKDSGSAIGNAIRLNVNGQAHFVGRIDSNTIREVPNARTIELVGRLGSGGANFKVTGNDIAAPTGTNKTICDGTTTTPCPLAPVYIEANSGNTVCAVVSGNTAYNPQPIGYGGEFAYYLHIGSTAPTPRVLNIENNGGDANATAAVTNHNTPNSPVTVDAGVGLVNSGACGTFPVAALSGLDGDPAPTNMQASVADDADAATQNDTTHGIRYGVNDVVSAARTTWEKATSVFGRVASVFAAPVASAEGAAAPALSAPDVSVNVGTLPAGKSVTIVFQATINSRGTGAVSNQGAVSGSNFTTVQTDDPDVAGSANPTTTSIDKFDTTTAITSDTPDPSVTGESVTVNYTVTGVGAFAPAVTDATNVVTVSDGTNSCTGSVTSGSGSCTIAFTSAGSKSLTASFAGNADFKSSASTPATPHTVNPAETTTMITSDSPDPSVVGQQVTINYSVSVNAPGSGSISGTSVVMVSDGTNTCTGDLTNGSGSCSITFTSVGSKSLTATYASNSNFNGSASSPATAHVVNAADTTTSVSSSQNPSVFGQSVTFTANVSVGSPGAGTPTGSVQFKIDGSNFGAPVALSSGSATSGSTASLTVSGSPHTVEADYLGDSNFNASAGTLTGGQTVDKANTTTSITSVTPEPSTAGQAVTINYSVSVNAPGSGTVSGANVVTVSDGAGNTCTGNLTSGSGSCQITFTSTGAKSLNATYAGDGANFNGSSTSAPTAHTVNPGLATHLSVTAPMNATAGSPFNVTVTALDAYNNTATGYTGTVHFTSSDGQAILPTDYPFVGGDAGVHTFSVTLKTKGSQSITATDTANSSITGNTSVAVDPATAALLVVSAPTSAVAGVAFNVTVTAKDAFNNIATGYVGTVHFTSSDGAASLPSDYVFTPSDAGIHTFSVTLNTLGSQSVTATDTVNATVTGSASVTVTAQDLTVTKSNNVSGATTVGNNWTWTLHVANSGTSDAVFASGQTILLDNLPTSNISYGAAAVGNVGSGVTGSANIACGISGSDLTCTASGGSVTLGTTNGSFDVSFTATPSVDAVFANPHSGGVCKVDPNDVVPESSESNNTCSDSVTVTRPTTTVTSINRSGSDPTNASSVSWTVTFANAVSGLTSSNFTLVPTGLGGTPTISSVNPVGSAPATTWTVTASTGTGDGSLGLTLTNDTNLDHSVSNAPFSGQVYTVDRTGPTVTSVGPVTPDPRSTAVSGVDVVLSEVVNASTFDYHDLTLTRNGGGNLVDNTVTVAFVAGTTYHIGNLGGLTGADGAYVLTVDATGIQDAAGNAGTGSSSDSWLVDTTPPTAGTVNDGPGADIDFQLSTTTIAANWTGFADAESGIIGYEWAIGTTSGNANVQGFTSVGNATSASNSALALTPDQTYYVTVRAISGAGLSASATSDGVTVDTTAPETSITPPTPANPTNSTSASFSFSGNDGSGSGVASFECKLDGGSFTTCTSPQSYSGLTDGSHTFQVRAIDSVGNTDATPASYTWTVDTTAPETSITPPTPTNPTNSTSASFSFSGNDGSGSGVAGFECKLDSGSFTTCTSPQGYSGLSDGSHTFQVRAIDNAGNADPSPASSTWTVDTVAPSVTINQASTQADPATGNSVHFTAIFNEPVNGFTTSDVSLSGSTAPGASVSSVTGGPTTFDVAISGMTGDGSIVASIPTGGATDSASNLNQASTSTDNTVTYIYDTTPPDTTIAISPPSSTNSTSASFSFSGNDGGGSGVARFECKLDSGSFTTCTSLQSYSGLTDGSYTFQVRAVDNAGNTDPTPASYTWTVDTVKPTITITTPANGDTYSLGQVVTISYTCADPGGSGVSTCTSTPPNGSPIDTSAVGAKSFTVNATDNAGNANSVTVNYFVGYIVTYVSPTVGPPSANNVYPTGLGPWSTTAKWKLTTPSGQRITTGPVAAVRYASMTCGGTAPSYSDSLSMAGGFSGSNPRYDVYQAAWLFNWQLPGRNACYVLYVKMGTGQVIPFLFNIH